MDVTIYPSHAKCLRRAGLARAQLFAQVIEGKRYTTRQVAEILDVSRSTAYDRIKRGPYPLTWANLSKPRLEQP
ncbi:helix-turn-helix domain-containing protein [Stenotrophomonas maltophilia]|jgi:transcriptional regulator of acetoin/glycerol metabolism|uniref:helix-turn-helix domain-containing protein n=1 Tax=Stenotrophomonas maltophilia TaxID=40324 RepID=UPI001311EE9B|nr:helix-turn-helix domain-containing protein [Stenotrophomonas maltophilia]MBH1643677.1 helix-turn-helix domain-containing protein [Stenotrophomonas maltophilia]MBH1758848.1 helix-turn-helix domain-containing protein [Stenotrophomonas maltophilia]MBH1762796.1 helix-turn-helix domain-containing protein [Stenotrophomonas maltophilia]MBH1771993.1 helix-turn-helix domain-containing protein [Stenotrophomonas maltophilia]